MIDGLIRWSLDNRWLVLVAGIVMILWGWTTATRMNIDVFPDITAPTVTTTTSPTPPTTGSARRSVDAGASSSRVRPSLA